MTGLPRCIADTKCLIGENPLWHPAEQALYWCDIPLGRLYRHHPESGATAIVRDPGPGGGALGGFTIEQDGALLLFLDGGRISRWHRGQETRVHAGIARERDSRFNDVLAAPDGSVFCGTMSTPTHAGRVYRVAPGSPPQVVMDDVGCPNGMAFSLDGRQLYITDSFAYAVYVLPCNPENGATGAPELFLKLAEADGFPDGLTIDTEGYLWQARWGGGCVVRLSPQGREVRRIALPARNVASLTLGGPALQTLFVTTAGGDCRPKEGLLAGSVFALDVQPCGRAEHRSHIALHLGN